MSPEAASAVLAKFFIVNDAAASKRFSELTAALKVAWRPIGDAFVRNLLSVMHTGEFPFRMTCHAAARLRFQRLCFLEQEAQGKTSKTLTAADVPMIRANALKRLDLDKQTPSEMLKDLEWSETELTKEHESSPEHLRAYQDLLRQCLVMTWNSLEVLARDSFAALIRQSPRALQSVCRTEFAKSRFGVKRRDELLSGSGFDADDIVDRLNFNNLVTIRSTFGETFGTKLSVPLSSAELDLLYHRRHLVVHCRGVVDARFAAQTGDTTPVGKEIAITPEVLVGSLNLVEECGSMLIRACNESS